MATDEALFNPLTPEFHANPYPVLPAPARDAIRST